MVTKRSQRSVELGLIHIGATQLGMDTQDKDPSSEYRSMLWTAARVHSAADLDAGGRQAVLDHLKARGFKPTTASGTRRRKAPPMAGLIYHIWNCLADAQVVENRSGLGAWLKHQTERQHPHRTGWQRPEFLPAAVARDVIEQLKQWADRTGVEWKNG